MHYFFLFIIRCGQVSSYVWSAREITCITVHYLAEHCTSVYLARLFSLCSGLFRSGAFWIGANYILLDVWLLLCIPVSLFFLCGFKYIAHRFDWSPSFQTLWRCGEERSSASPSRNTWPLTFVPAPSDPSDRSLPTSPVSPPPPPPLSPQTLPPPLWSSALALWPRGWAEATSCPLCWPMADQGGAGRCLWPAAWTHRWRSTARTVTTAVSFAVGMCLCVCVIVHLYTSA